MSVELSAAQRTRDLAPADLAEVIRIDALHTGRKNPRYWKEVFKRFLDGSDDTPRVGLGAESESGLVAFLFGEVRAFEFGSDRCGWIFAVGVDPAHLRKGLASELLSEACRRFSKAGVQRVRTMVGRGNVPILSFFRSNGFVGGSFVQLELDLEGQP